MNLSPRVGMSHIALRGKRGQNPRKESTASSDVNLCSPGTGSSTRERGGLMCNKPTFLITAAAMATLSCVVLWAQKRDALDIYFVDVEGGQSTLFVSPSGQSLLVDTGFPGARDADRIAGIVKQTGLTRINYLVTTHYHGDHVGGVPELATRVTIGTFIDHGMPMEETLGVPKSYE